LVLERIEYYSYFRFLGSIIFIVSDLTIALTTFRSDHFSFIPGYVKTIMIMVTYWTSLFLIIWSNIEFFLIVNSKKIDKKII
jgi:hypothetical protein